MNAAAALQLASLVTPKAVPINRTLRSVSSEAVRSQMERILQSTGFVHAKRMRRFLEYIVEETLAGRGAQLCEYAIGVSVFARAEAFEPCLDPIVRNDARRLRQKLLEFYQRSQPVEADQVVIEVPKGGYVPLFRYTPSPTGPKLVGKYRLVLKLVRTSDDAEVWGTDLEVML